MDTNIIEREYLRAKNTPSDINEHIEVLYAYARKCESVTELGVRSCVATWALMKGCPNYTGYDMFSHPNMLIVKQANPKCKLFIEDVLTVDIEPTDFLFIDTFHTYTQLKRELARHGDKAKKFIGFHDTFTFALIGEQPYEGMGGRGVDCGKGLRGAINEFLLDNKQWTVAYKTDRNNGLTILQKA